VRRRGVSNWLPILSPSEPIEKGLSGMLNGIIAFPKPTLEVGDLVRADQKKWYGDNKIPEGVGIIKSTNWTLCVNGESFNYTPEAHVVWGNLTRTTIHSHDSLVSVGAE